jgi:hypothetical protein
MVKAFDNGIANTGLLTGLVIMEALFFWGLLAFKEVNNKRA